MIITWMESTFQQDMNYTQQHYYDPQYGTLSHSYCTGTYTVVVLLLWRNSTVTLEYPRRYSNRVAV